MSEILLQASQLSCELGSTRVLRDVDLELHAGQIIAVVGPNGAGKSSLLRTLAGDLQAAAGHVSLAGTPLSDWNAMEKARHLAMLPQFSTLNFPYLVEEVVSLGRIPHDTGNSADEAIVKEALLAVDAQQLSRRVYTQLSGGERQRVQLARVLTQLWLSTECCLLLDEPVASLDLAHQLQLLDLMRSLANKQWGILVVLHDLNLARHVADNVLVLDKGQLVTSGHPEDVLTSKMVAEVFGAELRMVEDSATGKSWLLP